MSSTEASALIGAGAAADGARSPRMMAYGSVETSLGDAHDDDSRGVSPGPGPAIGAPPGATAAAAAGTDDVDDQLSEEDEACMPVRWQYALAALFWIASSFIFSWALEITLLDSWYCTVPAQQATQQQQHACALSRSRLLFRFSSKFNKPLAFARVA